MRNRAPGPVELQYSGWRGVTAGAARRSYSEYCHTTDCASRTGRDVERRHFRLVTKFGLTSKNIDIHVINDIMYSTEFGAVAVVYCVAPKYSLKAPKGRKWWVLGGFGRNKGLRFKNEGWEPKVLESARNCT